MQANIRHETINKVTDTDFGATQVIADIYKNN